MEVLISGRAETAVITDRGSLFSIHLADPLRLISRTPHDVSFLLGDSRDCFATEVETLEQAAQELVRAHRREDALQLTLIALDREMPVDIRKEAVSELDVMLQDKTLRADLEAILFAHPIPPSLDLSDGLMLSGQLRCGKTLAVLSGLRSAQGHIETVRRAWESIPKAAFAGEYSVCQAAFVRTGLFRDMVRGLIAQTKSLRSVAKLRHASLVLKDNLEILDLWVAQIESSRGWSYKQVFSSAAVGQEASDSKFEQLFYGYYRSVVRFFANRGLSLETAEDLAQETFLRISRALADFRKESGESAFILSIASTVLMSHLRQKSTAKRSANVVALDMQLEEAHDQIAVLKATEGVPPLDALLESEQAKILRRALIRLPPLKRRCILLQAYQGLTVQEIATVMRVSVHSVQRMLHDTRERLRADLESFIRGQSEPEKK